MSENDYNRIAAVQKACDILKMLTDSKDPITGNEVAIRVEMSAGTVMCHLATLEKRGYVEQNNGGWALTPRAAILWVKRDIQKFVPPVGKTYKTISSVEKAIDIVEYLACNGISSLSTVAAAVGMSPSNARSHLETLIDYGYVMEMADHYNLGMRLAVLWARVKSNLENRLILIDKELESITIKEAA